MGKDTKKASKDKPKKGDKGGKGGKGKKKVVGPSGFAAPLTPLGAAQQPNLDKVVARLHEALVTQNWAEYHSLFHPSFARYVGGVFNENLLDELTISQSMELLFKHGTFLKLDVSKVDVVGPGNGYFRLHWQVRGAHRGSGVLR